MPYRRLPNTDQSRLRALRIALEKLENQDFTHQIVNFKTIHEAESILGVFENQMQQYRQALKNQVEANKRYQKLVGNVRMYISHFIQVLNLSVIRGDIKKEHKKLYQLDPEVNNVPDLTSEAALLHWGKCIIDGENERLRLGGFPIYNPTIAKVKVHYEIFKENKLNQKLYQSNTSRTLEDLGNLRIKVDEIIIDIWNQVEANFKDEKPYSKIQKCKEFGLIYYYRKGEKKLLPEDAEEKKNNVS
ncbi:MAG: hypothetical protein BWZ11_01741 [Bacteroidetes bacterium ADurb.BinA395]|nr:MAG: hypothetical protein BWZ11_01741 [Bacteroidetes bacterium ADurb.BinA395]